MRTTCVISFLLALLSEGFGYASPKAAIFNAGTASSEECDYQVASRKMNCSHRGFVNVPTGIPGDVFHLSLSYNMLVEIRNGSLRGLSDVVFLSLRANMIRNIQSGAFIDMIRLQTINLLDNRLNYLPEHLFSKNLLLTDLYLRRNLFPSIPNIDLRKHHFITFLDFGQNNISSAKFNVKLSGESNITLLDVTNNSITCINEGDLEELQSPNQCTLMDFTDNRVTRVERASFNGTHIRGVSFKRNPLLLTGAKQVFEAVAYSSQITFISFNKIKLVDFTEDFFAPLKNTPVDKLYLGENNFTSLPDNVFRYLTYLHRLSLVISTLKDVSFVAFKNMTATTVLFLSSCGISRLTTPDSPGVLMPSLLELRLENNALNEIRANEFVGFPKLQHLYLSFNNIKSIHINAFSGLENLLSIHLDQNNLINTLRVNVFQNLPSLRVLDISESKITGLDPQQSLSGLTVLEELLLQGNNLHVSDLCNADRNVSLFQDMYNLQALDLSRNLFGEGFPPSCFKDLRDIRRLYLRSVTLNVLQPNLFDDLRNLETLDLDDNKLQEIPSSAFSSQSKLASLYISRNQISSLPTPLVNNMKNLSHLFLARTDVSVLPEDEFSSLLANIDIIDLSYNSLSCSCKNAWFRNWVHANYDKVFLRSTKCSRDSPREFSGRRFIDFEPIFLCGPKVLTYVGISVALGVTIFCVILIYYNRWWINYKLFMLKLCVIGYTEVIDDDEYQYDINIIFHDNDEEWVVNYLVPQLQDREPEVVLCVGDDDLPAGMLRLDAAAGVIDNSYKSVFIITNAAINNAWYMAKLRLALQHINHSQRDAILLIFLEDIEDEETPYIIRLLMSVNRPFLRWSDDPRNRDFFWDELMKTVRKTAKIDVTLPI